MPGGPTRLQMSDGRLAVAVDTFGAELASLKTPDGSEWLWQGDPTFWSGRAPVLFPVVGRSPEGRVSIGGESYPMGSHGFARDSAFAVVDADAARCRLRLTDSPATRKSFPFAFALDLVFALDGGTFTVEGRIANTGDVALPCSLGLHPAFAWPLPGAAGRPHVVALDSQSEPPARRLDGDGLTLPEAEPSVFRKGRMALRPESFDRGAVFHEGGWGRGVTFGVEGGPEIRIETEGFPYLGLWSRPGAPFLCIEPCAGLAPVAGTGDALDDRPGLTHIPPGGQFSARMAVTPIPAGNLPDK